MIFPAQPIQARIGPAFSIAVCTDPEHPAPVLEVAGKIRDLYDNGALPRFTVEYHNLEGEFDGLNNCRMVAIAFMTDVTLDGSAGGWSWCRGRCKRLNGTTFQHSWLEYDGCAVDATFGDGFSTLIINRSCYRKTRGVRSPKIRNAKQFRKWMLSRHGSVH